MNQKDISAPAADAGRSGNLEAKRAKGTARLTFKWVGLVSALLTLSLPGRAQNCQPPPSGLLCWWPGNGNGFDVCSGHHVSLVNGASTAAGFVGQAFRFDGVDDEARFSITSDIVVTNDYTVDAWIFPQKAADPSRSILPVMISTLSTSCGAGFSLFMSGNGTISFETTAGFCTTAPIVTGGSVPLNTWSHVAATIQTAGSTKQMKLYVNGLLVNSLSTSLTLKATPVNFPLSIGGNGLTAASHFQGLIDEVDLFNRGLSQTEIQSIYAAGAAGKCLPPNAYFPTALLDNTTFPLSQNFLGPPDDKYTGLGSKRATYDFGAFPVLDGAGPDFNVYEVDFGTPEFQFMDVLVSANGVNFVSVKASEAAKVPVTGDQAHNSPLFARSYDLASSGLASVRYIRVQGLTTSSDGFDLDAIGAIHFASVPIANAGPDQAVFDHDNSDVPTVVVLDGSGSAGQDALAYSWSQIGGPAVVLSGSDTVHPSFTAPSLSDHPDGEPQPIQLTFRLIVTSVGGAAQDDVTITVKHDNLAPVASVSAPQVVSEGTTATLDGSASIDPDSDPLVYTWTQTAGTPVTLSANHSNSPLTSFLHMISGTHCNPGELLEFTLTVSDGIAVVNSDPVQVYVKNVNHSATVTAGADQNTCDDVDMVALDGSASDPDGDLITSYSWTQVAGPAVTLLNADTPHASFTPPFVPAEQGSVTLTFELGVSDACSPADADAMSASATVNILVKHANRAPSADSGPNQTVPEGATVSLDGSGSFDPDNDPIASYSWSQTAGTPVVLSGSDTAHPSFTAPDVGPAGDTLRFELVVTDSPNDEFCGTALASAAKSVEVAVQYVNQPPTIQGSEPVIGNEGEHINLHLTASDPDGNPLTWSWTQLSGPAVTLDLLDPANPTFVAPQVGCAGAVLSFRAAVDDGYGGTAEVNVEADVSNVNNPPVADAGPNQSVVEGSMVALSSANSSDPDGEPLSYEWTQLSGSSVVLSDSHSPLPTFNAPLVTAAGDPSASETLIFQLTVTDSCGDSATDLVEVKVTNVDHSPIAHAGGSQTKCEGTVVNLNGNQSSDPDGDDLTYSWAQLSGPPVTLSGADTATVQFTTPQVGAGGDTLVLELTVSDPFGGIGRDTATVAVLNCNNPPNCSKARASMATLWPPNHSMIPVSILGVQDPDNDATISITSVTQDEPVNGQGDGDTGPDAVIRGDTVLLRAERAGKGNGRVYHIHFTASDGEASCSGVVKVSVPRDKSSDAAIDGGELYNSAQ